MKTLHINSYYCGSKFYRNLYDQQVNTGLDISVFVPTASSLENIDDFGKYTTISVNHSRYDRLIFHIKHTKILKDIIKKYDIKKYTLIHAHSLFSNGYVAMKLKKKYGIPYIVAVRNTDVNTFFKRMIHLRRMGIDIIKNANGIIFLSKCYRDEVIEKYIPKEMKELIINKTWIIPNGIDDFWMENRISIRKKPDINDLKLLYVGVVNKNKNILTTSKAIEHLRTQGIKARLTVVGRIDDYSIYDQIKELDYVDYIEPKPRNELIEIYRQNDIFIMPSIHESFGLVYAEAMSQGLPVIYTRSQGFDGQFEEGVVGFSVNCYDSKELAAKIIRTIDNYSELSMNCTNLVSRFDWNYINKIYLSCYRYIINNKELTHDKD
ncbi:glycosyltransferase family 4 protein [Acidaminobacter hydrogenoformans]|uniref:Glycosyltransferase involved in cell wall bisynthesis n=1 Tax=Acidaminobacter hydrogenoformans DSM 2784 TaxID=1120920 RepID=A0A1G5S500_9FIRM|nr:glycosyltransferase family 4 protein [Acidaminobacter hydrogenoformans]SCZ81396.1 Glycosyltransferase involved in cell wall bisynthesis [Acidaminobacter hydrogenoformans DSM 2784]